MCAVGLYTNQRQYITPISTEKLTSYSLQAKIFSMQKVLREGTSLIYYPYKIILTWFRPVLRPKPEKVGLIWPTGHLFPSEKNFILLLY